jgi:hypothetical protein
VKKRRGKYVDRREEGQKRRGKYVDRREEGEKLCSDSVSGDEILRWVRRWGAVAYHLGIAALVSESVDEEVVSAGKSK